MNPNSSLLKSYTLWFILLVGVGFSFYFAIKIISNNPIINECYPFYSEKCQQLLLTLMKLPILLLTATVTLGSLWGLVYRSQQTAIQIDLTLQNNMYSHYLSHKSEFIEIISDLEKTFEIRFINPYGLYRQIFTKNNSNYWSPDSTGNYLSRINKKHLDLIYVLKDYEFFQNYTIDKLNSTFDEIHTLYKDLYFSFEPELELKLHL